MPLLKGKTPHCAGLVTQLTAKIDTVQAACDRPAPCTTSGRERTQLQAERDLGRVDAAEPRHSARDHQTLEAASTSQPGAAVGQQPQEAAAAGPDEGAAAQMMPPYEAATAGHAEDAADILQQLHQRQQHESGTAGPSETATAQATGPRAAAAACADSLRGGQAAGASGASSDAMNDTAADLDVSDGVAGESGVSEQSCGAQHPAQSRAARNMKRNRGSRTADDSAGTHPEPIPGMHLRVGLRADRKQPDRFNPDVVPCCARPSRLQNTGRGHTPRRSTRAQAGQVAYAESDSD